MTIARRPLEDGSISAIGAVTPSEAPMPIPAGVRPSLANERPDVPIWALTIGAVLVLVLAGLVVQTFTGRPLVNRIAALVPAARSDQLTDRERSRVLYVPGATVKAGQIGVGTRGQDRAFQVGDVVLLGGPGRLVRLEEGDRLTELRADEDTTLQVTSLGAWNPANGTLAGVPARYTGGAWSIETPALQSAGASLHVKGAPEEDLTPGFQLTPPTAGRVRRSDSPQGPILRIRPTGRSQALLLEAWDPLPTLDNVTVTVQATVRASEGATIELALSDVVDAAGTIQRTADRRAATSDDEWFTLRVQRRVLFGAPTDRYSLALIDVRNRDWLEVRELGVYLGVLP